MTLKSRKPILYGALGVILLLYVGDTSKRRFVDKPIEAAAARRKAYETQMRKDRLELAAAKRAIPILAELEEQSLPRNLEAARSRYRAWLLEVVKLVDFDGLSVDAGDPVNHKNRYHVISFTVKGQGTLAQVARFLHSFYDAGHLHKISSMTLTPLQAAEKVDVSLTIEALVLPNATRADELTETHADWLVSQDLNYYEPLAQRNLFRAGPVDVIARTIVLTAITSDVHGVHEAWFTDKKTGKTTVLRAGDPLNTATLNAEVVEVNDSDVVVEVDGQRRRVTVGKSLADTEPIALAAGS